MTEFLTAAACYVALLFAACYAVAAGLDLLTSPQAVHAINVVAARIAE